MKKYYVMISLLFVFILLSDGCKVKRPTEPEDEYPNLISGGWDRYKVKDYYGAIVKFGEALATDSSRIEGYVGAAWCLMKLDSLIYADVVFYLGSVTQNSGADIFAGWAFTLNALKQYETSNDKVNDALNYDSTWLFRYDTTLSKNDLIVLKAYNYYMLGDFNSSLLMVQILNPNFVTDVTKPEGIAALAIEIERLRLIM
jgi:hypothetical protein